MSLLTLSVPLTTDRQKDWPSPSIACDIRRAAFAVSCHVGLCDAHLRNSFDLLKDINSQGQSYSSYVDVFGEYWLEYDRKYVLSTVDWVNIAGMPRYKQCS